MKNFLSWLFGQGKQERDLLDAADKLQLSMRTTAKCRYNASVRLEQHGRFSFFTTTVLSLGLVFIPLMQNAGVPLAYKANVLNMMQIFLGVAVLVYSVVIGTARFDMRSTQLTECGDKLKELIRELDKEREANQNGIPKAVLTSFQERYSMIVTDVENHIRNDYRLATLEMKKDYFIKGLPRLKLYMEAQVSRAFGYLLPMCLMIMEVIFITDMMGGTKILTPYLNGNAVEMSAGSMGVPN